MVGYVSVGFSWFFENLVITKKKWRRGKSFACYNPIGSMYGIFTYIYHKNQPNVGIYIPYMDPMGTAANNIYSLKSGLRWIPWFC